MSKNHWPTATPSNPCPICDHTNRCRIAPDGTAAYCWRDGDGKVHQLEAAKMKGRGYLGQANRRASPPSVGKAPKAYPTAEDAIEAARIMVERECKQKASFAGKWIYQDRGDVEVFRVVRFNLVDGDKRYRPIHPSEGGWRISDPSGALPLYRLPGLISTPDQTVFICEGEKAADAAGTLNLLATTSSHGSGSAEKTDWTPLAGRNVVILPDNDSAGEKYAQDVARLLVALAPPARVKIVELPGLPDKGDLVEYIAVRADQEPEFVRASIEALVADAAELAPDELIGGPVSFRYSQVKRRDVEWLWPNRIARGKLTLIFGDPGKGKSFLAVDLAARVSTGRDWPDGCGVAPKGTAILVSYEDAPDDTIGPRLDKAGADSEKVLGFTSVKRLGENGKMVERLFTLADLPQLEVLIQRNPDTRLVVIDPVSCALADSDSHKNAEIRGLLAPLAKLANDHRVAIVMVTHMSKGAGGRAMYRAMGSLAFIAAARSAWVVVPDNDDPKRRLFLPAKNNIGNDETGLAYTIDDGVVVWDREPVTTRADDALAMENGAATGGPGRPSEERDSACEWLKKELGDLQEHLVSDLRRNATEAGLAWRTVQRAASVLNVMRERSGFGGGFIWRLRRPGTAQPDVTPDANRATTPENQDSGTNGTNDELAENTAMYRSEKSPKAHSCQNSPPATPAGSGSGGKLISESDAVSWHILEIPGRDSRCECISDRTAQFRNLKRKREGSPGQWIPAEPVVAANGRMRGEL